MPIGSVGTNLRPDLAVAAILVIFYNHQSSDPNAGREDTELTQRLREAGRILGIELLDHLVLGDEGRSFTFKERGLL